MMKQLKERKALTKIAPYKAARSLKSVEHQYNVNNIIKLAGNENRLGCSHKVIDAIQSCQTQFSFYPDMNCTILREKLSKLHHIPEDNLVFGNGSFELISLIASAYLDKNDEALIPIPSFGWYKNVTLQMDAVPVYVPLKNFVVDLNALEQAVTPKTKIIWLCNPNNPIGTVIAANDLLSFFKKIPSNILVVLDEAYIDFIDGTYIDTVKISNTYKNIILLRTFSKLYGLASFRIGYGIANKDIIEKLNRIRPPVNVNLIAQKAAEVSLEDDVFRQQVLNNNQNGLKLYYNQLDKLKLTYIKSNCNFILVHTGLNGDYVENKFLENGIMIRNGAEFELNGWIRISIGTYEENQKVLDVLKIILKEKDTYE